MIETVFKSCFFASCGLAFALGFERSDWRPLLIACLCFAGGVWLENRETPVQVFRRELTK